MLGRVLVSSIPLPVRWGTGGSDPGIRSAAGLSSVCRVDEEEREPILVTGVPQGD